MILYASALEFNLRLSGKWKCPKCGEIHEEKGQYINPYRTPAEEPIHERCGCGVWLILSLYSDEYNTEKNEECFEELQEE